MASKKASATREVRVLALAGSSLLALAASEQAQAACTPTTITPGTIVTCTGTQTTTVGSGPSTAAGVTVNVNGAATISTGNASAISISDSSTITLLSGALVKNAATTDGGPYDSGNNTVGFRNSNTLTVQSGAEIYSSGTYPNAEAVNPEGTGNTIDNYGTIRADNNAAIWFQNTSGLNTVVNETSGVIQGPSTTANVIGGSGDGAVDFTNRGSIIGSLVFSGGDDTLHLYTGSSITGSISGDGGTNRMTLNGAGTDTMSGAIDSFQSLIKQDTGTWTLTGSVGNIDGSTPLAVEVANGTLVLTGDNSGFIGTMTVDTAGILQAMAQSLPPTITDNGQVQFIQTVDGTFAGAISGSGSVAKLDAGTLTLTGTNTFTGGLYLDQGVVAAGVDSALGASTGALTFNGGTLRLTQNFNLSASRAITLNAANGGFPGGGVIDADGHQTTVSQAITGAGGLTLADSSSAHAGVVTLTGASTYTGGTTIAAGTLQLGNGGLTGSIVGDVTDNGTLAFDRADTSTFGGVISGSGAVNQIGTGTTVLTGASTYTGGTTISAGTLQLGNGGTTGSLIGDVTDNGTLAFDRADAFTFAGLISGTGGVNQIGSGTVVFNIDNTYTGATNVMSGTLAIGDASHRSAELSGGGQVSVASGATFGGYGSAAGDVVSHGTVAVADALPAFAGNGSGAFTIGGNFANEGVADLSGAGIGNLLTIKGDYGTGSGSGALDLRTLLNGGGPLSNQATDRLLVEGAASGSTVVNVAAFGEGAYTSVDTPTAEHGISLIQVGGSSSASAFELAGGYVTGGTPYQYKLYAFGPGSANGSAAADQSLVGGSGSNWDYRLESVYVSPSGPVSPVEPPTPDQRPEVAPQVPSYISLPPALLSAGLQDLDSLHRRLGEIRDEAQRNPAVDGELFVRAYGSGLSYESNRSFADYGFNSTQDYAATQFGVDGIVRSDSNGTLRLGLAGALGRLWLQPYAVDGVSTSQMDRQTLMATATYQARSGWYLDFILAAGLFNGNVSTSSRGEVVGLNGSSLAWSLEAGYPIALGAWGLTLEPQAQLVYQHLNFGRKTDSDGVDVNLGPQEGWVFRGGARLVKSWTLQDGSIVTPYLKANLLQGFGDGGLVDIGSTPFATGRMGTSVQFGAGATGSLTKAVSLYGEVTWQTGAANTGYRGWGGNVGLRYAF